MGKIKWGMAIVDGRGKVGGTVMSKNKGGAYLKNKVSPSQPRTASQTTARQRLTNFAQGFRGLTAAQITSWNSAVQDFLKTDVFGDLKTPSGINLYTRLNVNLATIGVAALTLPPLPSAVTGPTSISATATAGAPTLSIVFALSPVTAGMTWIIQATRQMSPGRSAPGTQFRTIGTIAAAATTPNNALAVYNTKFGTLVAGQKIFIRIYAIAIATGLKSQALTTNLIVAA